MTSSWSRDRAVALPRRHLAVAVAVWLGCWLGLAGGLDTVPMAAVAGVVALAASVAVRRVALAAVLVGFACAGFGAGMLAAARIDSAAAVPIDRGGLQATGRVLSDPALGRFGPTMLVRASGPTLADEVILLVALDDAATVDGIRRPDPAEARGTLDGIAAGDMVTVDGVVADDPGRYRGQRYRASLEATSVTLVTPAAGPFFGPGNLLRRTVLEGLAGPPSQAAALVAGFLVGDTEGLSASSLDELRQAGLTHFVAVSGSNVAMFLGAWWLVIGPLRLDPRLRAGLGILALGVFVVATRWEPSVMRAASMAGVLLVGRIVGIPIDPWRALGMAVVGLLLWSAELAIDVGFQLSVAATAGVMLAIAVRSPPRPRWLWTVLIATAGAQLAVLPILLVQFGTVPLLSPVANVLAMPLVTAATILGGIGAVTGLDPALDIGLAAAQGVLGVAGLAAGWPQLDAVGLLWLGGVVVCLRVAGNLRPILAVAAVAGLVAWGLPLAAPTQPVVVFLDVGQGDAILLRDPPDMVVLVDGGPDPVVLAAALRRHGVGAIDLLIVTHGDADHTAGLEGVFDQRDVGEIWYPAGQETGELLTELLEAAAAFGVPATAVGAGHGADLGRITVELLGPQRRYAADNDGSIVMAVSAGGVEVLLTGDVEAVAQNELPARRPDVLQVPHHGSSTTDLVWLKETVGSVAVISVGDNRFGHPTPEVLDALATADASIRTTLNDGDVLVPLCPCRTSPP
ncbi:MAG: ComEC/Rec2 family competence protein [Acidimicrobiia bacterium]|nr:ComEC/Rec2 family competence protein [Acidimicrobiia bacterium]